MLRYYEEQGLLEPARDENGYRSYAPTDTYRALLHRHLDRVEQRIDCLSRNRDALRAYIEAVSSAPVRRRSRRAAP